VQNQYILPVGEAQPAAQPRQHVVLPPPKVEPLHEVFAEAMLEANPTRQRRSPLDWVVSLIVHVAILGVLVILPLFFTSALDMQNMNLTFLAAPITPAAPPPPPLTSTAPRVVKNVPTHVYVPGKLTAPSFIPKKVAIKTADAVPEGAITGVPGGIPGGQIGGVLGGVLDGSLRSEPAPVAPVAPVVKGPKAPVRVGGVVKAPRLLYGPAPVYPALAKMSRISGVVVIEAIIDEHGNVTSMHALSGQPLLIPAALAAVAKRKYQPTVLDGEPTPIDLRVEITFTMD